MAGRRHAQGFTLIEILITTVLISVGLLGVAALQLTTLRGNYEAYVRSQASVLANDILDRMRANPIAFRSGRYDVDYNVSASTDTRAAADLVAWQAAIDQILPGGATDAAGRITRVNNIVTVSIRWRERPEGNAAQNDTTGEREFRTRSEI